MAGALTSQIPVGHPPQFLINRRNQLVQGGVVAIAPGNQLLSDLMWRGVIHVCTRGRGKIFYRHGSFYACLSRYSTVRRKPRAQGPGDGTYMTYGTNMSHMSHMSHNPARQTISGLE